MRVIKRSCRAGSLLFAAAILTISSGCGYKTNPVPPQTVVPKAILDLRYALDEKGATLTWTYPNETISGKDITDIRSFDLYRAEIPLKDFCSSCPIPFGEPLDLPGGATGTEQRATGEYVSGMLRSGNKYFFKITSRTSYLAASGDSNIISFVYHTPAAAPQNVQAAVGKNMVKLSWNKVTTLLDGESADLPMSYQVLRSENGQQFTPVNDRVTATAFTDKTVAAGKSYQYKIKSSMSFEEEMIDGAESTAVAVKVMDKTAPSAVTGLTVVASAINVRVFWNPSDADDLAGYRIYKRAEDSTDFKKVGEVGSTQTIFIDNDAVEGEKAYYAVSAFDTDGNEGSRSKEATTRH